MQNVNSTVVVLGTGGTIAGTSPQGADERNYRAAQLSVAALLEAVPGLPAGLVCEQVAQVDSKDMGHAVWLQLAQRVSVHLASSQVGGVVVTHGTDTLEETAFFLQRVLAPAKPVVFTAAMRPATAAEPDGPGNLRDAVALAADASAHGVLVVMGGVVFGPRDVRKAHPTRLDAFSSGSAGPLGQLRDGKVSWRREVPREVALGLDWLPANPSDWPRVDLVVSHAGVDGALVDALCGIGTRGIVAVGTGNGTLHEALEAALLRAQSKGVAVRRATRCRDGAMVPRSSDPFPDVGELTPAKARIELMLELMRSTG